MQFDWKVFGDRSLSLVAAAMPLTGSCFYRVEGGRHLLDHQLFSLSPYWLDQYRHHFWRLDPLHPERLKQSRARLQLLTRDSIPHDGNTREYFEKFLVPQKTVHQTELYFRRGPLIVAGASLLRNEAAGAFTSDNIMFLEKFVEFVEGNILELPDQEPQSQDIPGLTLREQEIAALLGAAICNKEIGRRLNIALPTVKTHVSRILVKAGVQSRAEFIKKLHAGHGVCHLPQ
jgi:DNA-binding CsgD family transcriptional regulator